MSDDDRPLIDNPYRASHTPIYVGDVNVTDLMARAWDRGFAAGDERLRAMLGKVPREQLGRIMQEVAATPNAPKADAYSPTGIMVRNDIAAEVARRFPNGGTNDG